MDFDNVMPICQKGQHIFSAYAAQQKITCLVDLSHMRESNAVALALMLDWLRAAKRQRIALRFAHLSVSLQRMLETFGLTEILLNGK